MTGMTGIYYLSDFPLFPTICKKNLILKYVLFFH